MMMNQRFRGFLPVVIDIETGGFDPRRHAVLEIGAVFVGFKGDILQPTSTWQRSVHPYTGSQIEPASLKITGIDLDDPQRKAHAEGEALHSLFREVRTQIKEQGCHRAIMVAHNASFDQQFLNQAIDREQIKRSPFHPFSSIDTASLAAIAYGHTVLAEACSRAGVAFESGQAHNALYDATCTAELFCSIVNSSGYDPARFSNPDDADDQDDDRR